MRKAQMARFVKDFQKRVARFARLKSDAKSSAQRAIARQRAATAVDDGSATDHLIRRRQQKQLDARVQLSHAVILEREESIHRIHQDVVEVSNIMSDLARIVQEQQLGVGTSVRARSHRLATQRHCTNSRRPTTFLSSSCTHRFDRGQHGGRDA